MKQEQVIAAWRACDDVSRKTATNLLNLLKMLPPGSAHKLHIPYQSLVAATNEEGCQMRYADLIDYWSRIRDIIGQKMNAIHHKKRGGQRRKTPSTTFTGTINYNANTHAL
jgi:hypothetical protein